MSTFYRQHPQLAQTVNNTPSMKSSRIPLIFLIWAIIVLTGYYFFHPLLQSNQLKPLLDFSRNFILSGSIVLACAGIGTWLMRVHQPPDLALQSMLAALGAGVSGLVWLGIGALGLMNGWLSSALIVLSFFIFRKEIYLWCQGFKQWKTLWCLWRPVEKWLAVGSITLIIFQLGIAAAPPVKYDALTYHLALPRLYLEAGRLVFTPHIPYWGHPQLVEMLYTWAMTLGTPSSAALLSWWCSLLFLSGMAGFAFTWLPKVTGKPPFSSQVALYSVILILSSTTARWMMAWAYTDLFSAWFGLAAFHAFFLWQETGKPSWISWAGTLVGFAVGTKYTAGILGIAVFGLGVFLPGLRKFSLRQWTIGVALALLAFLPWGLKNYFSTGNPLFPYIFPTPAYPAERLAAANLPPGDYSILPQLILPLYITWTGIDSASGAGTDLGPLLILFAIPGVFMYRQNPTARFLGASLVIAWGTIALAGARYPHLQQTRLYFALLPALVALASWAWPNLCSLKIPQVSLQPIITAMALIILMTSIFQDAIHWARMRVVPYLLGIITEEEYLQENLGAYIYAMKAIDQLPPTSKILMLWEARSLYAPLHAIPDPWIDIWREAYRTQSDPNSILEKWKSEGITHLLVYQSGADFMRAEDRAISSAGWEAFERLLTSLPAPVNVGGQYYLLYQVQPPH
ncbi:MAG TPA: hypothetical protein DEQ80_08545 [Anaerolinea thermolimosa]|uniref:Glycosyltransferase RgtA/B/C/D-like domain-containing protein n=1 Tax=Anaerolinea thermolimosa TaxID=229919 RepID=A0A3D1JHA3_9CHLR|nr:hypothetical protein [Anaerolinea thermolimosa]